MIWRNSTKLYQLLGGLDARTMSPILALLQAGSQWRQNRLAQQATEQRFGEAQDVLGRLRTQVEGEPGFGAAQFEQARQFAERLRAQGHGDIADRVLQEARQKAGVRGLAAGIERRAGESVARFEKRQKEAMARFKGLGEQERKDIDERFRNLGAKVQSDLATRGLSGTTIAPSLRRGVERERSGEQGRLAERLRAGELNLFTGLSGETLAAQERADAITAGARELPFGYGFRLADRDVALLASREDVPPDPRLFANTMAGLGAGSAPNPELASGGILGPALGGGIAATGAIIGGLI